MMTLLPFQTTYLSVPYCMLHYFQYELSTPLRKPAAVVWYAHSYFHSLCRISKAVRSSGVLPAIRSSLLLSSGRTSHLIWVCRRKHWEFNYLERSMYSPKSKARKTWQRYFGAVEYMHNNKRLLCVQFYDVSVFNAPLCSKIQLAALVCEHCLSKIIKLR